MVVILTWLEAKRGAPGAIRCDNGPEFVARVVGRWLAARRVGPLYIAPGSPWENGYSESFNSRMKAEFADREVFGSLLEAKVLGAEYQRYWNQERLHYIKRGQTKSCERWWANVSMVLQRFRTVPWGLMLHIVAYGRDEAEARKFWGATIDRLGRVVQALPKDFRCRWAAGRVVATLRV